MKKGPLNLEALDAPKTAPKNLYVVRRHPYGSARVEEIAVEAHKVLALEGSSSGVVFVDAIQDQFGAAVETTRIFFGVFEVELVKDYTNLSKTAH